ncbi:cobalt-precorrin 5A hydrolase [Streptococcus catagoni]|uniref:cobalt-precorrin 5A hydrolase n=1 Tax=Streptococcus catagoni TaxID=2654874 RepID=UPI0039A65E6A
MSSKKRRPYAIVALTESGKETALSLQAKLEQDSEVYTTEKLADQRSRPLSGSPRAAIAKLFTEVDVLIGIMATGIVVRAIAPVIVDKETDPAVIVMDEKGQNVISLLSGHLGGANKLTKEIARLMGAHPVITTATDVQDVVALDTLAQSVNGWRSDLRPLVKPFNQLLASGQPLYFYQEKAWIDDFRGLIPFKKEELKEKLQGKDPLIIISTEVVGKDRENLALIHPKPYVLGVGARKNTDPQLFKVGFEQFCQKEQIDPKEIGKIVSIDFKKDEKAILALAKELACPFETYSKEELLTVADKYPQSEFVKKTVGVGSVAQASADLASQGQVLSQRFAYKGCTYALGKWNLNK